MTTNPSRNSEPDKQPDSQPSAPVSERVRLAYAMALEEEYRPCLKLLLHQGVPPENIWEVFAPDASGQRPDIDSIKEGIRKLDLPVYLLFDSLLLSYQHLRMLRAALQRPDLTRPEQQGVWAQLDQHQKIMVATVNKFEKDAEKRAKQAPDSARKTASSASRRF